MHVRYALLVLKKMGMKKLMIISEDMSESMKKKKDKTN